MHIVRILEHSCVLKNGFLDYSEIGNCKNGDRGRHFLNSTCDIGDTLSKTPLLAFDGLLSISEQR